MIAAALAVIVFAVLLHVLGIVARTKTVVAIGRQATATMRDTSLSDRAKEEQMQRSSLQLFRLLALLVFGTLMAIAAPLGLVWLAGLAGLLSLDAVLEIFLRWDFILGSTILGVATYAASVKWLR